jgi:hypothetical protein
MFPKNQFLPQSRRNHTHTRKRNGCYMLIHGIKSPVYAWSCCFVHRICMSLALIWWWKHKLSLSPSLHLPLLSLSCCPKFIIFTEKSLPLVISSRRAIIIIIINKRYIVSGMNGQRPCMVGWYSFRWSPFAPFVFTGQRTTCRRRFGCGLVETGTIDDDQ